ncbi:uncharacterized protein EKO05_0005544 [Ascochyta rabiei]|uniref:uncharacterized protein n=1 Tax=Didymella rabiei TaxID=5454 RepID=UPI0021FA7EED|nr:uncharacterized protein EKO05_0005544 [Ascochyta rabiei]UPX15081.1 hypothetical protein EKO05_0005544 [Ascochyta rabiei]
MTNALHGVLHAIDTIANAPALLSARLLDPVPIRPPKQSASDLTPPRAVSRKRRLTLPLDAPVSVPSKAKWLGKAGHQRTCDQAQSPIMRLPAELRSEIWKYVVLGKSNGVVEIGWRSKGHSHGRASAYKVSFDKPRDEWGPGLLGMLCSCRVIYSETIHLIYSLPIFSFHYQNVETLFAFLGALLPHRRDQIRILDLRWLGQCKMPNDTPQPQPHQMNRGWSYTRISNIRALSELPRPAVGRSNAGFVNPDLVIDDVLGRMKGLEMGGVMWGCRSTGCFRQGEDGAALADVFVNVMPRVAPRANQAEYVGF